MKPSQGTATPRASLEGKAMMNEGKPGFESKEEKWERTSVCAQQKHHLPGGN
jgi:hypothetical protein